MGSTPPAMVSSSKRNSDIDGFFSWRNLRSLSIFLLVIFAIRWSVAAPYFVPTASMEPTIKVGDRLLAYKLAYQFIVPFTDIKIAEWGKPERGDIIVFRYPKDPSIDYVKRVVAVAGDELQIIDHVLFINGIPQTKEFVEKPPEGLLEDLEEAKDLKELYLEDLFGKRHYVLQNRSSSKKLSRSVWPPDGLSTYRVPDKAVFCIGDNRDNSTDSRIWNHVPLEYVRGKALLVIWSMFQKDPTNNWPSLRFERFGQWLAS